MIFVNPGFYGIIYRASHTTHCKDITARTEDEIKAKVNEIINNYKNQKDAMLLSVIAKQGDSLKYEIKPEWTVDNGQHIPNWNKPNWIKKGEINESDTPFHRGLKSYLVRHDIKLSDSE